MSRELYMSKLLRCTRLEEYVLNRKSTRDLRQLYERHCMSSEKFDKLNNDNIAVWETFTSDQKDHDAPRDDSDMYYGQIETEFRMCFDIYERIQKSMHAFQNLTSKHNNGMNDVDKKMMNAKVDLSQYQLRVLYKRMAAIKMSVEQDRQNTRMLQNDLMQTIPTMTEDDQSVLIEHFSRKIQKLEEIHGRIDHTFRKIIQQNEE